MTGPDRPRRGRPPSGGRDAVLAATLKLLASRGAARLTTREVAREAGVSEGSVFYHFGDRAGLLRAVIEDAMSALGPVGTSDLPGPPEVALTGFADATTAFLDRALVALVAAQSDADLRAGLAERLTEADLGPHRGIGVLAAHLRRAQESGLIRADVAPEAVATLFYAACFEHAATRLLISAEYAERLPALPELTATMLRLLAPGPIS